MKLIREDYFQVNEMSVDVDIEFEIGFHLLTGRNGIGKSSFFEMIKSQKETLFKQRKLSFMDQFPLMPINEIRFVDTLKMMDSRFDHFSLAKAMELVDQFDIRYLMNRPIKLLSGGENQLVKFILAVTQDADFYFLDEPLQFLDKEKLEKVKITLRDIATKRGVFVIEHQSDQLFDIELIHFSMKKNKDRIIIDGN